MSDRLQPARHLEVKGARNVRELGGYRAFDGRTTRWRTFLRADSLHQLPPPSQAALIEYGVRAVIDLRDSTEVGEKPDVFSGSSEVAYYHRSLRGDQPVIDAEDMVEIEDTSEWFGLVYSLWLDRRKPQLARILATLAEAGERGVVFHCAGGKDRTGLVAALLLGLAGVPAETIAEDYALTARYLVGRYVAENAPREASGGEYTWRDYEAEFCPQGAMLRTLRHLNERYGGAEAYVRSMGLSQDLVSSLRNALLG